MHIGRKIVRKQLVERKPLMNQRKAKEPSDEVQGADSKPPKEKGELSDWEE